MAPSDYVGRTVDIWILRDAPSISGEDTQQLFGPGDSGQLCTGSIKLAQRWLLEFLTARGSMPFHMAKRGTTFMTALRAGRLRTEFDVKSQFAFAAADVRIALQAEETENTPLDERIDTVSLLQLAILDDAISLSVRLTSQSGDAQRLIVPISLTTANMAV